MSVPDLGRYVLLDRIATGGMGEVWRARDDLLHREVAVKLLKSEYADNAAFRERFATEARNAAALHHPGIAIVFDVGEVPDEGHTRPYLVMELVNGKPLSALLAPGEAMLPERAADLVAQAAAALGEAHARGLVHRDVKPANLLVTTEGRVKLTDFGIARAADAVPLTQTGQLMGTPQYLSPEQVDGQSATPASDVYALGVVFFECLTGHQPFVGDTPVTTALAHVRQPVPVLPDTVPAPLRAVVTKALAKDPADRFADGGALAAALRGADAPAAAAVAAPTATQVMSLPPTRTRRTWSLLWPVALLLVLAGGLTLALVVGNSPDETRDTPGSGSSSTPARVSPTATPTQSHHTQPASASTRPTKEPTITTKSPKPHKTTTHGKGKGHR